VGIREWGKLGMGKRLKVKGKRNKFNLSPFPLTAFPFPLSLGRGKGINLIFPLFPLPLSLSLSPCRVCPVLLMTYTRGECATLVLWFRVELAIKLNKTANGV